MPSSRGALIVFEGADRAGKSTQCTMLAEYLSSQGIDAEVWRFPDRTTPIGMLIESYLTNKTEIDDAAVHLLFSANRWEKHKAMLAKLATGTTIIVDRYAYSGVAFTAAKALPGAWCTSPDAGLPAPDLVVFLRIDADEAAGRPGFGEERFEVPSFQTAVMKQFERLQSPTWNVMDARKGEHEIHEEIRVAVRTVVTACAAGRLALGTLW